MFRNGDRIEVYKTDGRILPGCFVEARADRIMVQLDGHPGRSIFWEFDVQAERTPEQKKLPTFPAFATADNPDRGF